MFLQYVFKPDPVPKGSKSAKTVHEELAKNLTTILRPATADHVVVNKFLKHSWFFFEVLIKSMALYLIDTDRIKVRVIQWWFVNPGSDNPEISLVRIKSLGNEFHVRTNGPFSNPEIRWSRNIDQEKTCLD